MNTDEEGLPDNEVDSPGVRMSFLDHLDELRKRLLFSVIAILVGFLVSFAFISQIFAFIMRPLVAVLPAGGKMIYIEPTEAFMLYMKIAAVAGLMLAAPFVLWQVWLFIAPGLYTHEKRFAIPFVVFSTFFFVSGALFSHYVVFPFMWTFFASFSTDYMAFTPRIEPVFSLYVKMLFACGLVFQMPTLVLFLARMGAVTPRWLLRNFKYAVLIIFVVAAIITPTADPVGQTMMALPMIALYVISILVAWVFQKRSSL